MRLTLFRHAIAEDHAPRDQDRELTPQGVEQLERMLDRLCADGWAPGAILHSPYVRTSQTALGIARRFPRLERVSVAELARDDLSAILQVAAPFRDPVLVGHQPTLGELLASLIGAQAGTTPLPRSGAAMIDLDGLPPRGLGHLVAMIPPPLCRAR
jgi:phosphohistidine phosphatase